MEIFDGIYSPLMPDFDECICDAWITLLYGRHRTERFSNVLVIQAKNNDLNQNHQNIKINGALKAEIMSGRQKIIQWIQRMQIKSSIQNEFLREFKEYNVSLGES